MSHPLDPERPSVALAVRFPRALVDRIDAEVERLRALAPQTRFGRSDAVRSLVLRGLGL